MKTVMPKNLLTKAQTGNTQFSHMNDQRLSDKNNGFFPLALAGILSASVPGFCYGSIISAGMWSQIWPYDALIIAALFSAVGLTITLIGWFELPEIMAVLIAAGTSPTISTILVFYVLPSVLPRFDAFFAGQFQSNGWPALFSIIGTWHLTSVALGWLILRIGRKIGGVFTW